MPTSIPGFKYDVVISYCQKDNIYNGWVSEFANNLTWELRKIYGPKFSVCLRDPNLPYENRHQKSLVFIPVMSHRYCNPQGKEWISEFKKFVDDANGDDYGIELAREGKTAVHRVVPILINKLEDSKLALLEKETDSDIKPIELIYQSSVIDRPLMPSDQPPKNECNTIYANQLKKVARAVELVIETMKLTDVNHEKTTVQMKYELMLKENELRKQKNSIPWMARLATSIPYHF
ncbi:MAG: hypothetical protein OEX02_15530 [Cyclobacteriaceae bacterium]|nr:hypothetical protein [Cyclobacteriaceae bacterium]